MPYIHSFYTEFVFFISIVHFFLIALGTKNQWNGTAFSQFIYQRLVQCLLLVLFSLCVTEGRWHYSLHFATANIEFYPTPLLTTTFLSFVAKVTLLILTIACVLLHKPVITHNNRLPIVYSILLLFITSASFILISSNDLCFAFVAMELQTLSLVAFSFVGHWGQKTVASEAVFRYFVNAAFASVCFLFSLSILYALLGSTHVEQLAPLFQSQVLEASRSFYVMTLLSAVLLFFAIFFKLTLAPFHHWVGDLYQGTSGYVGSFFTLVTKIPMWILLTKVVLIFLTPSFDNLLWSFQLIALTALAVGNFYAFTEHNFRRFWAVGSIGHMGQILLALLCFGPESLLVASFYLFLYLSANVFFWGLILRREGRPTLDLNFVEFFRTTFRLLGLRGRRWSLLCMFLLASIAGVPPAFGFAAKFYLFLVLYQTHNFFLLACVFFLNLVSLAYYIRLIRFLFFQNPKAKVSLDERQYAPSTTAILWGYALVALVHSFFGFWLIQIFFSTLVAVVF